MRAPPGRSPSSPPGAGEAFGGASGASGGAPPPGALGLDARPRLPQRGHRRRLNTLGVRDSGVMKPPPNRRRFDDPNSDLRRLHAKIGMRVFKYPL